VERFVYINIEPINGGTVLNVSEGGLCFQPIVPVQRSGPIRFWFSDHNRRIEVDGELVWTNETQKAGGLRFTALPPEAREPIRNWISHPLMPPARDEASTPSVSPRRTFPILSAGQPETKAAPGGSAGLAVVSPEARVSAPLRGFSGGLATGLLVSALVGAPFLFHSYRRQLGKSLIHWGERFAGRPRAEMQTMSPMPETVSPAPGTVSPGPRKVSPTSAVIPVPRSEKLPPLPNVSPAKPQQGKLEPGGTATATPTTAAGDPPPKATAGAAPISSTPATLSLPTPALQPNSNLIPDKSTPVPRPEPVSRPRGPAQDFSGESAGATSEMYFEVGKFKDALWAYKATDKLAQLGFHATVNQKGHLWMNAYYVLVGPYVDDQAEGARKNLVSRGYKPRAFERGSRNFRLRSSLTLNGTQMPDGDCIVSWESYSTHAIVKFVQNNYVGATADGKWVKRAVRYERDAFVYRKNDDGSQTLLEIQFAGMSQALVFEKSS
jgi:hypothetical protein